MRFLIKSLSKRQTKRKLCESVDFNSYDGSEIRLILQLILNVRWVRWWNNRDVLLSESNFQLVARFIILVLFIYIKEKVYYYWIHAAGEDITQLLPILELNIKLGEFDVDSITSFIRIIPDVTYIPCIYWFLESLSLF